MMCSSADQLKSKSQMLGCETVTGLILVAFKNGLHQVISHLEPQQRNQ